jgi:GNAT superfamily N-acetyltransferase
MLYYQVTIRNKLSTTPLGLNLNALKSFSLISSEGDLLAFGQYYLRLGKCHLERLVVSPSRHGQGIASHLISQLSISGKLDLSTKSCSLFILGHNKSAIQAYKKLGSSMVDYPKKNTIGEFFLYGASTIHLTTCPEVDNKFSDLTPKV